MNIKRSFVLVVLYVLLVIVIKLGFYIASTVMYDYKLVVDGVLGLVILYLIYQIYFTSKKEKPENVSFNEILLRFPENIKAVFFPFFCL